MSQPPSAPRDVVPRYEERLLIITGSQLGLSGAFSKQQPVDSNRVYLGLCEGQVKIEEEEAHLINAVNQKDTARGVAIPAPKITRIPSYSCKGFKPNINYRIATIGRTTRNILRDLDEADLSFSDEIVRAIEAEASPSKSAHRDAQRRVAERMERHDPSCAKHLDINVSLPCDSVYSEDVLEWLLTVLDILFPVRIRQIILTERNIQEAYAACRLVVLDYVELNNSLIKPPDCFLPTGPTDYMSRITAEKLLIEQTTESDAGSKMGAKRRVCANERLERIAAQIPFISYSLFVSIFSYFVAKRKSFPLMPSMRDRPYRDWAAPQANQKMFLTQQEKRFPQQFCKSIKRAQVPLYYFNRLAEFVCIRESTELIAVINECDSLLAQLEAGVDEIKEDDDPILIPMDRPANTYKLERLNLNTCDEFIWEKARNETITRTSINKTIVSGISTTAEPANLTSVVDIFANINGFQQVPDELTEEDIVSLFYHKMLALSA